MTFIPPSPEEIINGMFAAERTPEQVFGALSIVYRGIKEGEISTQISCWENIQSFFNMAYRMYVKNEGMSLEDAETGIHLATCKSPICRRLTQVYFQTLRLSKASESKEIFAQLRSLAQGIILGKPLPELKGKDSGYYDSDIGSLKILKAVDITDKCVPQGNKERVSLRYIKDSSSYVVIIMCEFDEGGSISTGFRIDEKLNINKNEGLHLEANQAGIDPELLCVIILANAPQTRKNKQLKTN